MKESPVTTLLDHLLDDIDPGVVSEQGIAELRAHRDRYQEIDTGLSFGRRLVQGRLDMIIVEIERRANGGDPSAGGLLARLPEVLSQHNRGGGSPRPVRETELPDFIDILGDELDRILPAEKLTRLEELDDETLAETVNELQAFERRVSTKRHEVHRIIDELQEEIVGRYRSGAASVDDLLR